MSKPVIKQLGPWERDFRLVMPRGAFPADTKITIGYINDGEASRNYYKINDKLADSQEELDDLLSLFAIHTIAWPQCYKNFLEEIRFAPTPAQEAQNG